MATAQLGTKAIGDIIRIKEDGVLQDFYVARQETSKNLTLLVRRYVEHQGQWHTSDNSQEYGGSKIDEWHNKTYYGKIQQDVRELIPETKVSIEREAASNYNTTYHNEQFNRKVFAANSGSRSGAIVHIPPTLAKAKTKNGVDANYWASSIHDNFDTRKYYARNYKAGYEWAELNKKTQTHYYRPLFFLPDILLINDDGEITFNQAPTAPQNLAVTTPIISNQTVDISWDASTDPDDDDIVYQLQYRGYIAEFADWSTWGTIHTGAETVYEEHEIIPDYDYVQYRVRATDTKGASSAWTQTIELPVTHDQPPTISGDDIHMGVLRQGFTYSCYVVDPEGKDLTITERVNGILHRTHSSKSDAQHAFEIPDEAFALLPRGENVVTITAVDKAGNRSTRTLKFDKQPDRISVTYTAPKATMERPHRINILPRGQFPSGAVYTAYVTNNGNDKEPVWEDCTQAVFSRVAHVFQNQQKKAPQWGVNFKLEIHRGQSLEHDACTLNGICIQWE